MAFDGKSSANSWLKSTDPRLATIQKWVQPAQSDTSALTTELMAKDASLPYNTMGARAETNLFYIEPTVPRSAFDYFFGLHVDEELISYSTTDTAGLSVRTGIQNVASDALTPVVDDSFYMVRGLQWSNVQGTEHAVYIEQALKTGRPSIVIKTGRNAVGNWKKEALGPQRTFAGLETCIFSSRD